MFGLEINRSVLEIFLCTVLLYDCIFVNLRYHAEYRCLYFLFPPKFYQTVFSQTVEPNNPCAPVSLCNVRHNYTLPNCYCDSECKQYDDCCFDAAPSNTSVQENLQEDKKQFFTCEYEAFQHMLYGILVIGECPTNYELTEISEKCVVKKNIHPVSAPDGTTFRNVYCAYCHNVHRYNAWRFEYMVGGKCYADQLLNGSILNQMRYVIDNKCSYNFFPPSNAKFRSCLKHVIRNSEDDSSCSRFQSPVYIGNQLFRNIYCHNASVNYGVQTCVLSVARITEKTRGYNSLVLTKIFNIRPVLKIFGQKMCEENYKYDMMNDVCVPDNCQKEWKDGCDVELLRNYKFTKLLEYVIDNRFDHDYILRLVSFIYLSLSTERYQIVLTRLHTRYKCGEFVNDTTRSCCTGLAYIQFSIKDEMTSGELMRIIANVKKMKWGYTEIRNNTVVSAFDVSDNSDITNTCNVTGSFYFDRYDKTQMDSTTSRVVTSKPMVPPVEVPTHAEGVMMVMNEKSSSPELRLENWKLQFDEKNESNHPNLNRSLETGEFNNGWSFVTILTYVTLGMSCCSLILTLCVYSYFGLFQSSSGVMSKCMMVTMLSAQLLFIVGVGGASNFKAVCTAIGVLSHYLWLGSFVWMSIVLFDILKMIKTLSSCPAALQSGQKVSKAVYCTGFLVPFLIVLPCAILDIFSEVDIGYSSGDVCFPTGFLANLFSFTLPVVLSLFFNIVTSVVASVSLYRYNDTVLLLQSVRQARTNIPVYMRLSILCACPWILGIFANIFPYDALRYIYILLAGLHGTFVGISFLLVKSVRSRIRCARPARSSSPIQLRHL